MILWNNLFHCHVVRIFYCLHHSWFISCCLWWSFFADTIKTHLKVSKVLEFYSLKYQKNKLVSIEPLAHKLAYYCWSDPTSNTNCDKHSINIAMFANYVTWSFQEHSSVASDCWNFYDVLFQYNSRIFDFTKFFYDLTA